MLNKKILLIGGYGFLGCNILKWADDNSEDIDFTVLSSIRSLNNHEKFNCVKDEFFGEFGDDLFLKNVFLNTEYDYVIHNNYSLEEFKQKVKQLTLSLLK